MEIDFKVIFKKILFQFGFFALNLLIFVSCSIEKRHYMKGFYINVKQHKTHSKSVELAKVNSVEYREAQKSFEPSLFVSTVNSKSLSYIHEYKPSSKPNHPKKKFFPEPISNKNLKSSRFIVNRSSCSDSNSKIKKTPTSLKSNIDTEKKERHSGFFYKTFIVTFLLSLVSSILFLFLFDIITLAVLLLSLLLYIPSAILSLVYNSRGSEKTASNPSKMKKRRRVTWIILLFPFIVAAAISIFWALAWSA